MQRGRRRFGIIPVILLCGGLAGGQEARAGATEGSWEGGAYLFTTHHDVATKVQDTPGVGLRVGYNFKPIHEFELDFDKGSGDAINFPGVSYDVSKLSALYVRTFLLKGHEKLLPTLLAGLGEITVDNGTDSLSTEFLRFGGGFKYFLTPRVGVRLDASVFRWRGSGQVVPTTAFFAFDVNLGVAVLFGGKK